MPDARYTPQHRTRTVRGIAITEAIPLSESAEDTRRSVAKALERNGITKPTEADVYAELVHHKRLPADVEALIVDQIVRPKRRDKMPRPRKPKKYGDHPALFPEADVTPGVRQDPAES